MKRTNRPGRGGAARWRAGVMLGAILLGGVATFVEPSSVPAQERPGRGARPGGEGGPGRGFDRGARPGRGENPGQPGAPGQNAPGQPGKAGGENQKKQPERAVPLDQALEKAEPTKPMRLNQQQFTTRDGWRLVANYYKGAGIADAPAVLLLHGRDGKKEDFDALAKKLAEQGCAVIVPDLRGCGESTSLAVNDMSRGPRGMRQPRERKMSQFNNDDLRALIEYDKEVWFNFLLYLHNKELLNIKKTVVVGSELGAALAATWARDDWNGKGDAAQNVVGVALLSPDATNDEGKFNALTALDAYRKKAKGKSSGFVVFVGQMTEDKFEDAKKIQKKIGGKADEELPPQEKTIPIVALKTEKQGVELLKIQSFGVSDTVVQFVANRMSALPKKRQKWEAIEAE
ncbi:MAG: alpha/beta fold hydrolase [Thermoguttaceae bacterium]|nr:alpha/beta fold hydrolase [Thermoguttaceae bacterium]